MKPFAYKLIFIPTGQYYYGIRYSKNCQPSDLFTSYFTSSTIVKDLIKEHGTASFKHKITKIFSSQQDVLNWETRLLLRVRAASNPKFLNKSNNRGQNIFQGPCTEIRQQNIKSARLKTPKKECPHCLKLTDPGNFARFHGDNCKLVNPNARYTFSEKCKESYLKQVSNGTYSKPKPKHGTFTCPYCLKTGSNWGNMQRFHFDNCGKPQESVFKTRLISCVLCRKVSNPGNFKKFHGYNCKLFSEPLGTVPPSCHPVEIDTV